MPCGSLPEPQIESHAGGEAVIGTSVPIGFAHPILLTRNSLPLAMIPAYSGFIVEMEVFTGPKGAPMQSLLTDSMMAFRLFLRNGIPGATIYRNQFAESGGVPAIAECSGPRLQPWQWNNIKVVFDQKHFTIYVNDVPGKPVKANGYHRYPRATVMGASERGEFFTGMIRKLKISVL